MAGLASPSREIGRDCAALALVALLSAVPYVFRLGFSSDDWGILASFTFEKRGDLFAMFPSRPVQAVQWLVLFDLFGADPLGYELTNIAVIAAAISLFYLLLLRFGFRRTEGFAAALLYLLLPQLSTVRVWISAAQIPLSMMLMLVSLHAQLSFARSGKLTWGLLAVVAALLSIGAYEIFAPFIIAFPFALLLSGPRNRRTKSLAVAFAALLLLTVLYKIFASGRAASVGDTGQYVRGLRKLISPAYDWRRDTGLNMFAALDVHFRLVVEGWLKALTAIGRLGWATLATALAIALIAEWRLLATDSAARVIWLRPLLLGIAAFALGHATFLIVSSVAFSPSGIDNRVLVAAAMGVALIFVAAIAFAARGNKTVFALAMAGIAFCATLRVDQIGEYWAEAPALQERILAAARHDLRAIPAGSTIILDGVCPYHGPAIVFETSWDVGGALSLALGREVSGDAASPRMSLEPEGLKTSIYGEPSHYPWSPRLFVYNPELHAVVALPNPAAAANYFHRAGRWPKPCPPGFVGHGIPV